jgi:hypothetical protein
MATARLPRVELGSPLGSLYAKGHSGCRLDFHLRAHCHLDRPDRRSRTRRPTIDFFNRQSQALFCNSTRLPAIRSSALPGRNPELRVGIPTAISMLGVDSAMLRPRPR